MKKILLTACFLWASVLGFSGGVQEQPSALVQDTAPATPPVLNFEIFSADVAEPNIVRLRASGLPQNLEEAQFSIEPGTEAAKAQRSGTYVMVEAKANLKLGTPYSVQVTWAGKSVNMAVNTAKLAEVSLTGLYSDKALGHRMEGGNNVFRVFIPRGKTVELVIFDSPDQDVAAARKIPMAPDENQVFEAVVPGSLWGKYYGYRILERLFTWQTPSPALASDMVFADPYGKANAQSTDFPQKNRTLILDTSKYNWEGDKPLGLNISDLVIMESHIRDLTAHPSSGAKTPGYRGMVEASRGGLKWIKDLGINAVEFLPLQEFSEVEPPYQVLAGGMKNTWNVYGRNYWGYMTSGYFAPESYYASDATREPGKWNGTDGRAVTEFKDMVKAMHKTGVAVIMDVVYNHTASYDENTFKLIDKDYYFKKVDRTGTGNEMESRRLMVRRMILDSLKYWMTEYHVDGFRFDLATSHDKETVKAIADLVYSVNPKAVLIAEPWGGESATISRDLLEAGWARWNDGLRKAVRGDNRPTTTRPVFALGTVPVQDEVKNAWAGTSSSDNFAPWQEVNYIESHDDSTFGDILRISSGTYKFYQDDEKTLNRITNLEQYLRLTPELFQSHKVAALTLFLSQGPLMLHIGQEWARGKVTPDLRGKYPELTTKGPIGGHSDNLVYQTPAPNSYSADNETNWINFDHAALNKDLTDYYRGLIRLRISQKLLGGATPDQVRLMINEENLKSLGTEIAGKIYGFVNADPTLPAIFDLPAGTYDIFVDKDRAGTAVLGTRNGGSLSIPPQSGMILIKK